MPVRFWRCCCFWYLGCSACNLKWGGKYLPPRFYDTTNVYVSPHLQIMRSTSPRTQQQLSISAWLTCVRPMELFPSMRYSAHFNFPQRLFNLWTYPENQHRDFLDTQSTLCVRSIKVDLYGVSRLCLCEVFSRFYPEQLRTLQKLLHTLCGTPHHTIATWIKQPLRRYM